MAGYDLNIDELRRMVSRFLGYPTTYASLDTAQAENVTDAIRTGLRNFYFPEQAHQWSFLSPVGSIQLVPSQRDYDLPDNFGGLLSDFAFSVDSNRLRIQTVNDATVRALYAKADRSGPPAYCSIRVAIPSGSRTRHVAHFYPVPDEDWTLNYQYVYEPEEISAGNPHPLGGAIHGATILESCLAAAEQQQNPETLDLKTGSGFHTARFQQRLAASIELDKLSQSGGKA